MSFPDCIIHLVCSVPLIADVSLTETNLLRELRTVTEWFPLGIHLNVPRDALSAIERQYSSEGLRRVQSEMISQYLNTGQASWKHVIAALRFMGENVLADRLEAKYFRQGEVFQYVMVLCALVPYNYVQTFVEVKIQSNAYKFYVPIQEGEYILISAHSTFCV